jgi:uncharacterized protein YggU (UPF0235/DUF167 family)
VRVRAAPVEGAANTALERLLADALGLPKSRVSVARGASARVKTVEIDGLDEAEVRRRLDQK